MTWLSSLPAEKRREIARLGGKSHGKQVFRELTDVLDLNTVDLDKPEDAEKLLKAVAMFLADTGHVAPISRVTCKQLVETVDTLTSVRNSDRKIKDLQDMLKQLQEKLAVYERQKRDSSEMVLS